ncbi:hypothetical protein E2C01_024876 [Portunus trituberculatus]|uniref:Uncharacterized protein n=1 Tax=Portunus trituberculatus TaxID=210409 RepID=A0A5B7EBV8_PORTR|nr:hypothetical protein [Portunus trituberculatus]
MQTRLVTPPSHVQQEGTNKVYTVEASGEWQTARYQHQYMRRAGLAGLLHVTINQRDVASQYL